MRRCSLSAPKTFAPGPMKSSAPPTCPKSTLSPLPLIRRLPPLTTTRIRDEKCYASGASRHQPTGSLRRWGVLVKDRYSHFWLFDAGLKRLWQGEGQTGHYPYPWDLDGDGRDEIAIGY